MNRRTLLGWTGTLCGLCLAGCTGGNGNGSTPTDTTTEFAVDETSVRTVSTGCAEGDGDASITVETSGRIVVTGTILAGNPCHDATVDSVGYESGTDTLSIDVHTQQRDEACVDCIGAVEYEVTVTFEGPAPGTVEVAHEGERVASTGESTPTETPTPTQTPTPTETPTPTPTETPTVREASFSVEDITSGTQTDDVAVTVDADAGTIRLDGTIWGSDGCKTAEFGRVEYDPGTDTLAVAVVTTDRPDAGDVCTQAIVEIDYVARITVDGGLPGTVEVRHDGRAVASVEHGEA